MKVLEWSQHYASIYRLSMVANSVVRGEVWPKFEISQAFIAILVICKNEDDPIENESARLATTCLPS